LAQLLLLFYIIIIIIIKGIWKAQDRLNGYECAMAAEIAVS